MSEPEVASSNAALSRTERVMAWVTDMPLHTSPTSGPAGFRARVGFRPNRPQQEASRHRGRHESAADPAATHFAQHLGAAARAGHLHLRIGDDHRGYPLIHRRRHTTERPELGQYHGRGEKHVPTRQLFDFFPGVFLSLTVLAVNLLGDGMRDALDPRLARRM